MDRYKDLILDLDTGELKEIPKKTQYEDMNTMEFYVNNPHIAIFGLGVTKKFLNENCLKPGEVCRRFHSAHLSDGIQGVSCKSGPYRRCEKASEARV